MRERKVMKKYYQPDFVPSKLPRLRRSKNRQIKLHYKGTKFNYRKEDVVGETYLGIRILMFYSKCTHCCAELTIKTDPRNSDYLMESGATRTFKPWRPQDESEMNTLAALHEMQSVNSGRATVSTDAMLQGLQRTSAAKEEDEVLTKSIVFHVSILSTFH
ncbi:hypothetical protein EUGRSUZ_D00156 [Eucalyptus grandis]|uniref:Uncharacterized protein n=2 Tax=Eucalyptus grandis TaxID=71139 RepID=A0ACC3L425_EUCGR|nr:hypothetical protein EUGRSUZ_D00156 [Eucalyptus grandis]